MNKQKVVIMTSGGLDSYVAYYYAKKMGYEPVPVWVDLGQPYAKKEEASIDSFEFANEVKKIHIDLLRPEFNNVPDINHWIIPGRNLLLAVIGASFGDRVWICALDGEMHKFARERDKTPEFYHLSSGLLTYVFDILRPETVVETPFANMTKTEIVKWALENGITPEQLLKTSSCYDGEAGKPCGKCGTCFKRWVALTNNGLSEEYEYPPYGEENLYAQDSIKKMKEAWDKKDFSHYSEKRIKETFSALEKAGIKIL